MVSKFLASGGHTTVLASPPKSGSSGGQVDLKSGWDSLWSAISGNLGGLDKVLTAIGVILVVGSVAKWLFERRKGGQGLGNSSPILWSLLAGATLASFAGYGLTNFAVTLAVRRFHLPIATAATGFGLVAGVAIGAGMLGGGWLADRIGGVRGRGLVSAAGALVAAVLFELALGAGTPLALAALAVVPLAAAHLYFGPTYATVTGAVPPAARASAIALLLLVMNLIGLGLGPPAVGALSDRLGDGHAATGLGRALALDVLVYLWAALHFALAARISRRSGCDRPAA